MAESFDFSALPDEEGYIYLDSSGLAQARVEITVVWARSASITTIVTVDKKYSPGSDGIEYLPIKIAESLERFPHFEGLSNLTAYHLMKDGRPLPGVRDRQKGDVGKYLKPGDQITCEISASDMWLHVRIQCPQARVELTFEVKVNRNSFVAQLRLGIFEYVCRLLTDDGKTEEYTLNDLRLNRHIAESRQTPPPSPRSGSEARLLSLEDSMAVSTVFDFISRYVSGSLERGKDPIVIDSENSGRKEVDESRMRQPDDILKKTLSVRKIQKKLMDTRAELVKKQPNSAMSVLILSVAKGVTMSEGIADELIGIRLSTLQHITKALLKWSYSWELVLDSEGPAALIYDDQSESGKDWLRNNAEKLTSAGVATSQKFEKCCGVVVPSVLGFMGARDTGKIAECLSTYIAGVVEGRRPAVFSGYGLAVSFPARSREMRWVLADYSLTSVPIVAQFSESYSDALPYFMEEMVREQGATFASSAGGSLIMVDRKVVSVQNDASVGLAIHAFCALLKEGR